MQEVLKTRASAEQPVCIVAAGGDGTVQDVINRYPDQRIAILPLGTENLLARYLGIKKSGQFVAEMISQGTTREMDLCQINQHKFALMASIGFDAAVASELTQTRKGHISHFSYLRPIWNTLRSYPYEEFRVMTADCVQGITAYHAIIVNIPVYGLKLNFAPSADDQDGLLEVVLFRKKGIWNMLKYVIRVMRGSHLTAEGVQILQAKQIQVESNHPIPVQTDGDATDLTPVEIRVLPAAARFIVPCSTRTNDQ